MPGIFVSHASSDKPIADPFVDDVIRLGCKVPQEYVFYSSGEDTGIPAGRTLNDYVRSKLEAVSLVVAIISPSFQSRPFCVAELGAAWSQVGKLFPIAVPGFERADMDGVLTGLVVRHLDDSAALDELHDLVSEALGLTPTARTWGQYKAKWLARVDEYTNRLTNPKIIAPADYDRTLADLEGARDALRAAESKIEEQAEKIERLATAKSVQDVTEILLPKDERKLFDVLAKRANQTLLPLPGAVREAIRYQLAGEPLPGPVAESMAREVTESLEEGLLYRAGNGFRPNSDFDEVTVAIDAVRRLSDFLDSSHEGGGGAFHEWYRTEYHVAPNLRLKRVWNQIFEEL